MSHIKRQVSRVLAVGGIPGDEIKRLTRGEAYTCCYGSESEHKHLAAFCEDLQDLLKSTGQSLPDFSPEELQELLKAFTNEDAPS
jgi:hypothetical protein